jgi:uncharacterized protein YbjT (DUF2867 family)
MNSPKDPVAVVRDGMYVILGGSGNTGSIISNSLLSKGQKVRVVGRDAGRLQRLVRKGGEAFTADVSDAAAVLHLRAAYFMENNLAAIDMIHGMGMFGHALLPDLKLPMITTRDVGNYAAQRLLDLDFSGKQTRELLGERDLSMTEATAVIAGGIGKPDLRYVQFPYDQVQQALTQMGFSPRKAAVYIEMFQAINAGVLAAQEPRSPQNSTPTSFERFVQDVFAAGYHGQATTA